VLLPQTAPRRPPTLSRAPPCPPLLTQLRPPPRALCRFLPRYRAQLLAVEGHVAGAAASNATTAALAAGAVAMLSLWLFWSVVTFSGLFTAAAVAVAARDVLVSAFAAPGADGGPKRD
jgi:hypothetical protein